MRKTHKFMFCLSINSHSTFTSNHAKNDCICHHWLVFRKINQNILKGWIHNWRYICFVWIFVEKHRLDIRGYFRDRDDENILHFLCNKSNMRWTWRKRFFLRRRNRGKTGKRTCHRWKFHWWHLIFFILSRKYNFFEKVSTNQF